MRNKYAKTLGEICEQTRGRQPSVKTGLKKSTHAGKSAAPHRTDGHADPNPPHRPPRDRTKGTLRMRFGKNVTKRHQLAQKAPPQGHQKHTKSLPKGYQSDAKMNRDPQNDA